MNTPFTLQEFLGVFTRYNQAIWPLQVVPYLLATALIRAAARGGRPAGRRAGGGWRSCGCEWAWCTTGATSPPSTLPRGSSAGSSSFRRSPRADVRPSLSDDRPHLRAPPLGGADGPGVGADRAPGLIAAGRVRRRVVRHRRRLRPGCGRGARRRDDTLEEPPPASLFGNPGNVGSGIGGTRLGGSRAQRVPGRPTAWEVCRLPLA